MRLAEILERLNAKGVAVDRSGVIGPIAEVYPAAAIARWKLTASLGVAPTSYKTGQDPQGTRSIIVKEIERQLKDKLVLSDAERERCIDSHDDLDAFVCALVARAVQSGKTKGIGKAERKSAKIEGWIHLPDRDSLGLLAGMSC